MTPRTPKDPPSPAAGRRKPEGAATSKSERAARNATGDQLSEAEKARLAAEASRDEDA